MRRFDRRLEGEERGTDDRVKAWCKFNGRIWLCVGGRRGTETDGGGKREEMKECFRGGGGVGEEEGSVGGGGIVRGVLSLSFSFPSALCDALSEPAVLQNDDAFSGRREAEKRAKDRLEIGIKE